MIQVPGFPADLRVMPPALSGPDDPDREAKVTSWIDWGKRVVEYRTLRWAICEGHVKGFDTQRERATEFTLCQHSPLYAIVMYMHIYETDPDMLEKYPWHRKDHGGWLPAVPFWYQAKMVHWFEDRYQSKDGIKNGMIAKCRRMGATDWAINWALAKWLFASPFTAKFVSRNQRLVYDKGNMDALLQRAIAKLSDAPGNAPIPGWLMPSGWDEEQHVSELKIRRPGSLNLIGGEATTGTAGRGGRATVAFLDEAAVMDHLMHIVGAIQATSPHVIMMSSETLEKSDDFDEIKRRYEQTSSPGLFTIDWWEHPFQNREWLEAEEQRYIENNRHDAFFREILRDPYYGETGWMYADARDRTVETENVEPSDHEHAHIEIGIDPGFRDETAIHWMLVDPVCGMDVLLNTYEASGYPPEYYAIIMAGLDPDDFPEFHFSPYAREFLEWVRSIPAARRICGDPAGTQSHGGPQLKTGKDDAWYSRLISFWADHGVTQIPIVVNWEMKSGREIQGRRLALMEWLRAKNSAGEHVLRFNNTPEVRATLDAIQKTKWQESDKRITEMKDAIHNHYSHRRSALEYLAVNRSEFTWTDTGRAKIEDLRVRRIEDFGGLRRAVA